MLPQANSWTVEQLADRLECSRWTINRRINALIESGEIKLRDSKRRVLTQQQADLVEEFHLQARWSGRNRNLAPMLHP